MRTHHVAAIGGDGIGPEVIAAGLQALEVCAKCDGGFRLEVQHLDWGSDYYRKHGVMMPEGGADQLRKFDAIYFGAVGAPDIPDHITLWGLRLRNLSASRPIRQRTSDPHPPGDRTSPLRQVSGPELDWVIVRENFGGRIRRRRREGSPGPAGGGRDGRRDVHARRRDAHHRASHSKLARSRPRKLLTVVTKSNAQRHGMVMWDEIAAEVAQKYPDVTWDKMLVDAMTMRMVSRPQTLDTIVATNLHADILSDLAAALAGSLGIAPTANLNPERKTPSMFEPIHGSAFDITGKGIANPIGTFWTGVMMLDHLGERGAADRLMRAVERVTGDPEAAYPRSRRESDDATGYRCCL